MDEFAKVNVLSIVYFMDMLWIFYERDKPSFTYSGKNFGIRVLSAEGICS